jgi:DNA-binding transcriptional regulator GbsR (MarR family)
MKTIKLNTKEELNIYMNPVRQQLLRQLNISGIPMTPKMLANQLQISASSVQHHIKKLMSLDLIELDHTELIKGITASYYVPTQVTVQIGLDKTDDLNRQREVLMQESIASIFNNYHKQLQKRLSKLRETSSDMFLSKEEKEKVLGNKNEIEIGNEKEYGNESIINKNETHLDIENLLGPEKAKELLNSFGDIMTGVIHLEDSDSKELMSIISNYIETHSKPTKSSSPWEYALILYNAKEENND